MIVIRWALSMVMAAGITLGLFYFMQALIATGAQLDQRVTVVKIVDATMPEIELEVIEEIDKGDKSTNASFVWQHHSMAS